MSFVQRIERYFEFELLQTNWKREMLAGITTFVTMAYIIFVNPAILKDAGLPVGAVSAATCICAGFASIFMGLVSRYPIALAPGMGLNAYFTYTVVLGLGIPWRTALAAVFVSGVLFLILTATGFRMRLVRAIPADLYAAVAGGIGLFVAMVGMKNAGLIVASKSTLVSIGNLRDPRTALAMAGLFVTALLMARRVKAAILIGIVIVTIVALVTGQTSWHSEALDLHLIRATAFQLDLPSLLHLGLLEVIFVFVFVDLFDNLGTLVAVTKKAGLAGEDQEIPRIERILFSDAVATIFGGLMGTSTVTSYIESAAGIAVGGRTGVTAIVTGLLFLLSLLSLPLALLVPASATAPALILVGALMMEHTSEIRWNDPVAAISGFLTLITIPLTFSIATGLSFGFVAYAVLLIGTGRVRKQDWLLCLIAAVCIVRFVYLST